MSRRIRVRLAIGLLVVVLLTLALAAIAVAWDEPVRTHDCSPGAPTLKWDPCMAFDTAAYGTQVIRFGHGGDGGWGRRAVSSRTPARLTTGRAS
jgi:hypothetical protein